MLLRPLALLAVVMCGLLGAFALSAQSAAALGSLPEIGLSDNKPETFSDPRVEELGLRHVRLITPFDAILTEPGRLAGWINAAARSGREIHVSFERRRLDRCPDSPCVLPTVEEYSKAFTAFHRAYPSIVSFTPWNEANDPTQPTATAPVRAAEFYNTIRSQCRRCTIVAGDVLGKLSGTSMSDWLARYRPALTSTPSVWGLHDYDDLLDDTSSSIDEFLASVPGDVWLTETGGIVSFAAKDGSVLFPYDELRAERATAHLLALLRDRPRVKRAYIYHWSARAENRFDSGLTREDGSERPAYGVLRRALRPDLQPAVAPRARSSLVAGPRFGDRLQVHRERPTIRLDPTIRRHRLGLRVGVRCRGVVACRGTVRVLLKRRVWTGKFRLPAGTSRAVFVRRRPGARRQPLPLRTARVRIRAKVGSDRLGRRGRLEPAKRRRARLRR